MLDILQTLFYFIVAISILVAIHEFGHFWVAKKLGVKVLRYSIGFGKPLWATKFGADKTEYVIASIPLGGYVRMLDEREMQVKKDELHRAFNRQSVYKRFAIVFAGPAFNLVFAVCAYWLMFVVGVTGFKPVIGDVIENTPAAYAELNKGDQIIAVNGKTTPIWDVALQEFLPAMIKGEEVDVDIVTSKGLSATRKLRFGDTQEVFEPGDFFKSTGFYPWRPAVPATIGQVLENSVAMKAGLLAGDRIVVINGEKITDWYKLVDYVSSRPNSKMNMLVERNQEKVEILLVSGEATVNNRTIGRIGITPAGTANYPDDMRVDYQYGIIDSVAQAGINTWEKTSLMINMLWKMIVGDISLRNISGPINIAVYAEQSASAGFARFVDFLAIVSISLGILNLLPVPILDGGHLMYYMVEMVRGRPVSEKIQEAGQRLGIVFLLMLMSLAFYNDIARLLNN